MKSVPLLILFLFTINPTGFPQAYQQDSLIQKGRFYFYWGYHHSHYTRADIDLSDEKSYDFRLIEVKGEDVPVDGPTDLFDAFAPYNIRLGYYLGNRLSLSLGLDHMKYKIVKDQIVPIKGFISSEASLEFAGMYSGENIQLTSDFFYIEHTDGLNYLVAELDYTFKRYIFKNQKGMWEFTTGLGLGPMIPRTDSHLFGEGGNHDYHLSGFGISAHIYPRVYFGRVFFIQGTLKGGYIHMNDILLGDSKDPDRAKQKFGFIQYNLLFGASWRFWKEKA